MVKPVNYDKVKEITQEKEEHPAVFTNKLTEAFRKYASTDLDFARAKPYLLCIFLSSRPDIRR